MMKANDLIIESIKKKCHTFIDLFTYKEDLT